MRSTTPQAAEKALKARCRTDRRLFARFFFHEKLDRAFSRFHRETFDEPKVAFVERGPTSGWRRARMVPRGNGKTTTRVRIEALHDIVYGLEPFIVIVAEQQDLSRSRLREIRLELERNQRLRRYYGDLVGPEVWRVDDLETANGVRITAKSMRGQVRGLTHPETNARPTKIFLDDAEHSKDVLNPALSATVAATFHEDIEGGGTTDGRTCIQFTGTPLHREALLPGLRDNPAWDWKIYPAIERWPERMDLWDECRRLWSAAGAPDEDAGSNGTASSPAAVDVAARFYASHREEMDRGALVLWPDGEPLFALMLWRWTNGEAAFSKEKLLVPRDPSLTTFDMAKAVRHTVGADELVVHGAVGDRRVPFDRLRFIAFHDPAKGNARERGPSARNDFAAIVIMAVEHTPAGSRFGHVVDCYLRRDPVSQQIEAAYERAERWRVERLILEADTYGLLAEDYRRARDLRRAAGRFWQVPLASLQQHTNKDARIASLEPAVTNGWITFSRGLPQDLWNQFEDHPTGDHDDAPDGVEACWRCASRKVQGLSQV